MNLHEYDEAARMGGAALIAGVDEAGRGPLAGPVFAAAVILPPGVIIEGLNDSKKLSEKKRDALYEIIKERAVAYAVSSCDHSVIDEINILNASLKAMSMAIAALDPAPDVAFIDGNRPPITTVKTLCIVGGDAKSASVAAASILAKVERDRFMYNMDKIYPRYNFKKHKGYPTAEHRGLVQELGPCPLHRLSFLKKIMADPR